MLEIWAGTGLLQLLEGSAAVSELPSYQGDRHHKKKLSSSSVHLSLAWPLDSDMWFSQPQRSLMVYSNIRDRAHYLHLPKRIEFLHRFQITARRKGLSGCQSEGSAKEHGNTKFQQSLARLTTLLRKIQSSAALKEVTPHCLPEIH